MAAVVDPARLAGRRARRPLDRRRGARARRSGDRRRRVARARPLADAVPATGGGRGARRAGPVRGRAPSGLRGRPPLLRRLVALRRPGRARPHRRPGRPLGGEDGRRGALPARRLCRVRGLRVARAVAARSGACTDRGMARAPSSASPAFLRDTGAEARLEEFPPARRPARPRPTRSAARSARS